MADVIPIFKKDRPVEKENYRPISLLPQDFHDNSVHMYILQLRNYPVEIFVNNNNNNNNYYYYYQRPTRNSFTNS